MGAEVIGVEQSNDFVRHDVWDVLLAYIEAGTVIPVIGPDFLQVEVDGCTVSLEGYLATRLASRLSIPPELLPAEPCLNDVVCQHRLRGGRREMLYVRVRELMDAAAFSPPKALRQLAAIRGTGPDVKGFTLYVTTTFDSLLEEALNADRFGGKPLTQTITYAPNDIKDLECPLSQLTRPTVYHLLGKLSALPSYVISEEDMLEFVCALQARETQPQRLFDQLETHPLLMLGRLSLTGWPILFLRSARRHRLSNPRDVFEIMAASRKYRDSNSTVFLQHFSSSTEIFQGGDAVEFVDELWQRWQERHPDSETPSEPPPPPGAMPRDAIFLSYSRTDVEAARTLKAGLDAAGLEVWFDFERLGAGDEYDLKIRNNIRDCSLFIPLLSRNTDARTEGYFRREWNYALDREKGIFSGKPFIVPVIVDDTVQPASVPPRFLEFQMTWLPGGKVTPEYVRRLREIKGNR